MPTFTGPTITICLELLALTNLRPLTYSEVVKADPFIRKLDNGVVLKIKQWSASDTMNIFQGVKAIQPYWDNVKNGVMIAKNSLIVFSFITQEIYRMTEKPKGWLAGIRYRYKYFKWANENIGQVMSIWEDLSKSQTCTFFFNRSPNELANGTGRSVQKDWFEEYCGDYDPRSTAWAFIRQKREGEKARSIERYYAQKKVSNGSRE